MDPETSTQDVVREALGTLNTELPPGLNLGWVEISELDYLEKNARFMRQEQFSQLVKNVKKDGALESVPLCKLLESGRYRVLSGNHRIRAASKAGLSHVLILFRTDIESRSEEVAKQLSHNAIAGEDDTEILRSLYDEIQELDLKEYSGLDDEYFDKLEAVQIAALSDAQLEYQMITFLFLPEEVGRLTEVLNRARSQLANTAIAVRWSEYDRLLDQLADIGSKHKIYNGATAIMHLLDIVEEVITRANPSVEEPCNQ